jgi:Immunoglobulin domain
MYMRNVCLKTLVLALTFVGLTGVAPRTEAQTVQTLVQFTNSWQYDQTGRQLPANWMSSSYTPDGQWGAASPGLLGYEPDTPTVYTVHAPIQTPLVVSGSVTTYYFRTTFNYAGSLNNVSLIGTNLVDDGCAIYLNGLRVGGVRIPAGYNALNAATFFTGGTEGALEVVTFTNLSALHAGANLLAVEVHQSAANSSDVMFGMKLISITTAALQITNQPQSQTVAVGDPVNFTVGVSGGPIFYRWQKGAGSTYTNIPNATNATYAIAAAAPTNAGNYRVIATNILNAVTSSVATLTVTADTEGPELVDAIANNVVGGTVRSNTINLFFNEAVNNSQATSPASVLNTNNYQLVLATNPAIRVPILSVLYNGSISQGALLNVQATNANWNSTNDYLLIVNNITDARGNSIAPNSTIGVSILITANLTQMADPWYYHSSAAFDPDVFSTPWYGTNYDGNVTPPESFWWGNDIGIFYSQQGTNGALCAGDTLGGNIDFQRDPTLFRRTFTVPAGLPSDGNFKLRYIADDGLFVYLNGVQIYSNNVPAGPVTQATRALTTVDRGTCVTNLTIPVTGLFIGTTNKPATNVLAVAVCQSSADPADLIFGLEMDYVSKRTAALPPVARLTMSRQACTLRVSWPTNLVGYTLQTKTNLNPSVAWVQVPNQTNPYTNLNSCVGTRFFRLFKQ